MNPKGRREQLNSPREETAFILFRKEVESTGRLADWIRVGKVPVTCNYQKGKLEKPAALL